MKKSLLFVCLISNLITFSQNVVMFSIDDCRGKTYSCNHHFSDFSLFRNDSLYGKFNAPIITTTMDSLPDGKYYIEYDTYFGKRKSESQHVDKSSFVSVFDVCVDELPDELRKIATNLFLIILKKVISL